MLKIKNLNFSYKQGFSLNIKSINIKDKALNVIIGPNGSGKTTFAKIISGLIEGYSGIVEIDNKDIKKLNARKRGRLISYIHKRMVKDTFITVEKFMEAGRYPNQHGLFLHINKEDEAIIEEMLDTVDLKKKKDMLLSELSDGELQRACIAKILCQETQYTVLDEPTSALDLSHIASILNLLKQLRGKTTFIVILHDINEAIKIYDNLICFNNGTIECTWEKDDFFDLKKLEKLFRIKLNLFDYGMGKVVYF